MSNDIELVDFFVERQPIYRADPLRYWAEVIPSYKPDPAFVRATYDLVESNRISIRSGQGVGKTAWQAVSSLWFLPCFLNSRVVATAPTRQQLHDVLWAEIAKWMDSSPLLRAILTWTKTRVTVKGEERTWFAVARTATKPENMQGFHEDNMLFLVDEASGVLDSILEAIQGTLSGSNNKFVLSGNPTKASGYFHKSYTKNRALFCVHRISARESPRTDKENIAALEADYGKDSNVVRVRVDGEPPLQDDDVFISITLVEAATMRESESDTPSELVEDDTEYTPVSVELGVDVARFGDDETVIAPKIDSTVSPLIINKGKDLMWTVGKIMATCLDYRQQYPQYDGYIVVKIDDTGLGGGVTDRLKEIKTEQVLDWLYVVPVNFAGKSPDRHYADISTYMWAQVRDQMTEGELALPNDADMVGQFSSRKYGLHSSGKLKLESKKQMKERGIKSPDRADAVALACLPVHIRK